MATADDLKKQQELNKALQEENEILRKRNLLQSEGYDMSSSLVESLKEVLGIRTRQSTFEQDILKANKDINKSILSQKSGLQDLQSTKIQIRKNNDLISKATVLQLGLEKSITTATKQRVDGYVYYTTLQQDIQKAIDQENKKLEQGQEIDERRLAILKDDLSYIDQVAEKEFASLGNLGQQLAISKLNTQELQKQTQERKKDKEMLLKLQASMGIAGALAQTLGTIPGIGNAAAKAFEDVERKLKADAEESGKVHSRWKTLGMLMSETGKHLGQALTDPAVILTAIYKGFVDVNKESVQLSRLSGQNGDAMAGANFALADTVDTLKVAGELTLQLGMNAQNVFSANTLAGAAELKNTMGLTAEQAGGLAVMAQTGGKDIKDMSTDMVSVVSSFNKSNRSAVSQGVALREAANASDSIKLSLGNNPKVLTEAAAAATRLGLSLQDVDNIAASLTDFQSSISNELEAELLTGKDLNLEKARELALNNNLKGVADEIFKNSSDITEFGKMNRIQQESYAKALGLTKDQLAKIAYQKAIEQGMTEDQAAAAAKVEASDMRRMEFQEKLSKVMDKLAQAFAPILDTLEPVIDILARMIAIVGGVVGWVVKLLDYFHLLAPVVLTVVAAMAAKSVASFFGTAVKGAKDLLGSMKELSAKGLWDKVKSFGSGISDAYNKAKGGGAADMVKSKSGKLFHKDSPQGKMITNLSGKTDKAGDIATDAKEKVSKSTKGSFKDSMKDVAGGLKAMGVKGVLQGIINLALAGPALILAVASIPFLLVIAAIGKAAGTGLKGLASGLTALGKAGVEGLIGVGLIAALGVAMIPFGYALGLAAPAIEAFGKAIKSTFEGIGALVVSVAEGFTRIMKAVSMDNIGPMLLLGPALFGIAAGLAALGIAGVTAIPGVLALTALSVIAPALTGLANAMGMGESKSVGEAASKSKSKDESTLADVVKKLDDLITVVKKGGDVHLDSNKVGKAQVLATSKTR